MDEGKRIDRIEIADIPAEIRELMLEEQTSMTDVHVLKVIADSRARVAKALKQESKQFQSYLESSDEFLRSHLGSADLVKSIHMSMMLPLEKLTTILQIFAQEMTVVVANNHGYILKYVGDAVIAYFPVDVAADFNVSSKNAVSCAMNILVVVDQGINDV
jgi:uncharacterized protein (UPF0335 family)